MLTVYSSYAFNQFHQRIKPVTLLLLAAWSTATQYTELPCLNVFMALASMLWWFLNDWGERELSVQCLINLIFSFYHRQLCIDVFLLSELCIRITKEKMLNLLNKFSHWPWELSKKKKRPEVVLIALTEPELTSRTAVRMKVNVCFL